MEGGVSIINGQINSTTFANNLYNIIKECINSLPTFDDQKISNLVLLFKSLQRFWIYDHNLPTVVHPIAEISKNYPVIGLRELIKSLPKINTLDINDKPDLNSNTEIITYLHYFKDVNLDSIYNRIAFRTFNNIVIAFFLRELLQNSDKLTEEDAQTIEDEIISIVITEPEDEKYLYFRKIPVRFFAESFYFLSKVNPQYAVDIALERMVPKREKNYNLVIYNKLLSQIYISKDVVIDEKKWEQYTKAWISFLGSKYSDDDYETTSALFFINFFGSIFSQRENLASGKFIYNIRRIIESRACSNSYEGPYIMVDGIIYTLSQHPRLKLTEIEYINKYLKKKLDKQVASLYIIKVFTFFLRGKHYMQDIELRISHANYTWINEDDEMKEYMFNAILSHPTSFSNAQEALAEFLLQYICNNIPLFVVDHLMIDKTKMLIKRNRVAFLIMFMNALSNRVNFPNFEDCKKEVAETAIETLNQIISSHAIVADNNQIEVPVVTPFIETLKYFQGDYIIACMNLLNDSYPGSVCHQQDKHVVNIKKWAKAFGFSIKDSIFDREQDQILFSSSSQMEFYKELMLSFSLKAMLGEVSNIKDVSKCILSPNTYCCSNAQRALCALAVISQDNANIVANNVVQLLFDEKGLYYHNVDRIITTLCNIADIFNQSKHVYEELTMENMTKAMIIGLCSNYFHTRQMTVKLIQAIKYHPLHDLFNDKEKYISEIAWNNVLYALTFQDADSNNIDNLDTNSFTTISQSSYSKVYYFYLAALAFTIKTATRTVNNKEEKYINNEKLTDTLMTIYNSFTSSYSCDKRFINNLTVFFVNLLENYDENCMNIIKKYENDLSANCLQEALFSTKEFNFINDFYAKNRNCPLFDGMCFGVSRYLTKYAYLDQEKLCAEFAIVSEFIDKLKDINVDVNHKIESNILISLKILLDNYFELHKESPNGPFIRKPILATKFDLEINKNAIFRYIFQETHDKYVSEALASFMRLVSPEGKIYESLVDKLFTSSVSIATNLLTHNFVNLLDTYIDLADDENEVCEKFFIAIEDQFVDYTDKEEFLSNLKRSLSKEQSEDEKKITNKLYYKTGSLLALAFFYLTNKDDKLRQRAYSLLANIAISASVIMNDPQLTNKTLTLFDSLKNTYKLKFPALCFHETKNLSQYISENFTFCNEQFIHSMFHLIKMYQFKSELSYIVLPWISTIRFNFDTNRVSSNTVSAFTIFTCEDFIHNLLALPITSDLLTLINTVLSGSQSNSINTIDFIVRYLLIQGQQNELPVTNRKNILSYLLSQNTKSVVSALKYMFDFEFWLFMMSDKGDDRESNYNNSILFCFSVLRATFNVWNLDDEMTDHVISFCIINPFNDDQCIDRLKEILSPLRKLNKLDNAIIASVLKNFPIERQRRIGLLCIKWGLCCGNSEIAARGLDIYSHILEPYSRVVIDNIISAIQVCCVTLHEATAADNSSSKVTTNIKTIVDYIATALTVLYKVVEKSDKPLPSLFFIATSLLSIQYEELEDLTNTTLRLILALVNHKPTISSLRNKDAKPGDYKDLLVQMQQMMMYKDSASIIYKIICSLLKEGLTHLILNGTKGFVSGLILMIQFSKLFGLPPKDVISEITEYPEDIPESLINDIKNGKYETAALIEFLDEYEISLIITILEHCIAGTNNNELRHLFTLCTDIIVSNKNISPSIFNTIIYIASSDNEVENADSALQLLQNFSMIPDVTLPEIKEEEPEEKPFPVIYFPNEYTTNKEVSEDSKLLFQDPSMFPLLPIYDNAFEASETARKTKNALMNVKVWPFQEWNEMFQEAKQKTTQTKENEEIKEIDAKFIEAVSSA